MESQRGERQRTLAQADEQTRERRVKIVTTLGPAVAGLERIRQLLSAGADVVRINAAHGSTEHRTELIAQVREAADELGKRVPILFDLQGLKIRTGPLKDGEKAIPVARGSKVEVVAEPVASTSGRIGVNYEPLMDIIGPGSRLLISDGLIELLVEKVENGVAKTRVGRGGMLLGRQGVTLPGAPIRGGALTDADRVDVEFAVGQGVDYLGLSFIHDADDLIEARQAASEHGVYVPGLIAKIERPEALEHLEEIAEQADGVMVARGDLGVQLPPERVPRAQKRIISVANRTGLPVITATQMLESMITQPVATRAETSDVANAVWDGTDAVMLSAETAVGKYPIEAVQTMDRIIREVEKEGPVRSAAAATPVPIQPDDPDPTHKFADAIARAAYALSDQTPAEHIVVFTQTGYAVRRVAKYRPFPPIIGVASDERTARRLNLIWGVKSLVVPIEENPDAMFRKAGRAIIEAGMARIGEYALIVGSLPMTHESGRTNLVHFRKLGT